MHPHLEHVFGALDAAHGALRHAVEKVPVNLREQRPADDRWSVAEVLDHLSRVEAVFTGRLSGAIDSARDSGLREEAGVRAPLPEDVQAIMKDRVNRRNAPDAVIPRGDVDSRAAWQSLEDARDGFKRMVATADGLALGDVRMSHPFFGNLNVYQWVELVAGHEQRHAQQIEEIAAQFAASA